MASAYIDIYLAIWSSSVEVYAYPFYIIIALVGLRFFLVILFVSFSIFSYFSLCYFHTVVKPVETNKRRGMCCLVTSFSLSDANLD